MLKEPEPMCCDTACREATVVEILEMRRDSLVEELSKVNNAIRVLKHSNPDEMKALKVVLELGHRR